MMNNLFEICHVTYSTKDITAIVRFTLHLAKSLIIKYFTLANRHIISTTEFKVKCAEYMKAEGLNQSLN